MNAMDNENSFQADDFISEAAPGIARHDVEAVARRKGGTASSYEVRARIYPKLAHGNFRNAKWIVMLATLGIYYLLPWIRWERAADLPNQFFLIDFASQRLLLGPLEIWAQEFYYVTGLLIISSLALFLVTAVAGRVWCGYACPQTVWTDLMILVERFWQGDRNQRMRLDQQPWTFNKIWRKAATHASWLLIGLLTGGALVFYFRDAPTLAQELLTGTAPTIAYVFLGIFAFFTYLLGGIAREQVCIYMCPWPRIQGAMLDKDSLLVSYREGRGEPRGPHKKGQTWEGRGDCIDCKACVAVCPMGIDIRNGPQLECIQCALCIDACNEIMDKVSRPRGLIAYATEHNQVMQSAGPRDGWRLVRARTILYSLLIALVTGIMAVGLMNRGDTSLSVLPDRNPLFVRLSDGAIRNGYTIKIANKTQLSRRFHVTIEGVEGITLAIAGQEDADPVIDVAPSDVRALKIFATVPRTALGRLTGDSTDLRIAVVDMDTNNATARETTFRSPGK